jgi:hypothetical protein
VGARKVKKAAYKVVDVIKNNNKVDEVTNLTKNITAGAAKKKAVDATVLGTGKSIAENAGGTLGQNLRTHRVYRQRLKKLVMTWTNGLARADVKLLMNMRI